MTTSPKPHCTITVGYNKKPPHWASGPHSVTTRYELNGKLTSQSQSWFPTANSAARIAAEQRDSLLEDYEVTLM